MRRDDSDKRPRPARPRLDYVTVWRWHFYAGLFCLPFFCWLAVTGSVYLFRPDVEAWLDRPYESLRLDGPRAAPAREARAALDAVPGSTFDHYEPPATATGAAQIVVRRDGLPWRVVVHPRTLAPLDVGRDDHRVMDVIARLHGELLLGERGSMLVELAGSWGVVMLLTGLYLWLPRDKWRLAGLFVPRLARRGRAFWRDLHATAGIWIALVTLLLLLSGLPWSANWGNYLTWARGQWAATRGAPDWTIGGKAPDADASSIDAVRPAAGAAHAAHAAHAPNASSMPPMPGMSAAEMAAMMPPAPGGAPASSPGPAPAQDLALLDRLVPLATRLDLPRPVWIAPPPAGSRNWSIASHTQDRPQRVTHLAAPDGGGIEATQRFADLNVVDRVVNVGISAHEGQLFGRPNQAILLLNAVGIVLIAVSGVVMWWRRRPAGTLGAPPPSPSPSPLSSSARPGTPWTLVAAVLALALVLPMFGASLLLVLAVERTVLRALPAARRWLGLPARDPA